MSDDVSLNFRCTGFNGVAARTKVAIGPDSVINCVTVRAEQLSVGPEQFLSNLLDPLIQLAPENFQDRAFGSGHAGSSHAAECPQLIETHDFNLGIALREFLADQRIFRGRTAVARDGVRKLNEPIDIALKQEMQPRAE